MKDRVGEKWVTNEGYEVEIVEYFGNKNCTVKFEDGILISNLQYGNIKKGNIRNVFHKSVHNNGYLGIGKYKCIVNTRITKVYNTWKGILERCYDEKYQEKRPTYKGCTVDECWHNFQNFAKWYEEKYITGYQLDKDILIKDNKIYSPETCCFVSQEINKLFIKSNASRGKYPIGVNKHISGKFQSQLNKKHLGTFDTPEEAFQAYKIAKEKYIKEIANKYKNKITTDCYTAMLNYKIEITD